MKSGKRSYVTGTHVILVANWPRVHSLLAPGYIVIVNPHNDNWCVIDIFVNSLRLFVRTRVRCVHVTNTRI
jgi:hypothetical protein